MDCGDDTFCRFSFNAKLFICACADGDEHGIVFLAQFLNRNVSSDPFSVLDFHTSLQNGVDIVIKTLLWQTVVRDAVAEHAAQFREHFKNGGLMSHELQVISCA